MTKSGSKKKASPKMEFHIPLVMPMALLLVLLPDAVTTLKCDTPLVTSEQIAWLPSTNELPKYCKGSANAGSSQEVHILNLKFSSIEHFSDQVLQTVLTVEGATNKSELVLILTCEKEITWNLTLNTSNVKVYFSGNDLHSAHQNIIKKKSTLPTDNRGLLLWIESQKDITNAITSYTEMKYASELTLHLGTDIENVPECKLNSQPLLPKKAVYCHYSDLSPDNSKLATKPIKLTAVNVIRVPPSFVTRPLEIYIVAKCSSGNEQIHLFLQSQAHVIWKFKPVLADLKIMTSSKYYVEDVFIDNLDLIFQKTQKDLETYLTSLNLSAVRYIEVPTAGIIMLNDTCSGIDATASTSEPPINTPFFTEEEMMSFIDSVKDVHCDSKTMDISFSFEHIKQKLLPYSLENAILGDRSLPTCVLKKNGTHLYMKIPLQECNNIHFNGRYLNLLTVYLQKPTKMSELPNTVNNSLKVECIPTILQKPEPQMTIFEDSDFTRVATVLRNNSIVYTEVSLTSATKETRLKIDKCVLKSKTCNAQISPSLKMLNFSEDTFSQDETAREYFQFQFHQPKDHISQQWDLECTVCILTKRQVSQAKDESEKYTVKTTLKIDLANECGPGGPKTATVVGVTFGAFLIGMALVATLVLIYIRTRPAKEKKSIPLTTSALDDISASHSIGSTQSTPCSTSSMA